MLRSSPLLLRFPFEPMSRTSRKKAKSAPSLGIAGQTISKPTDSMSTLTNLSALEDIATASDSGLTLQSSEVVLTTTSTNTLPLEEAVADAPPPGGPESVQGEETGEQTLDHMETDDATMEEVEQPGADGPESSDGQDQTQGDCHFEISHGEDEPNPPQDSANNDHAPSPPTRNQPLPASKESERRRARAENAQTLDEAAEKKTSPVVVRLSFLGTPANEYPGTTNPIWPVKQAVHEALRKSMTSEDGWELQTRAIPNATDIIVKEATLNNHRFKGSDAAVSPGLAPNWAVRIDVMVGAVKFLPTEESRKKFVSHLEKVSFGGVTPKVKIMIPPPRAIIVLKSKWMTVQEEDEARACITNAAQEKTFFFKETNDGWAIWGISQLDADMVKTSIGKKWAVVKGTSIIKNEQVYVRRGQKINDIRAKAWESNETLTTGVEIERLPPSWVATTLEVEEALEERWSKTLGRRILCSIAARGKRGFAMHTMTKTEEDKLLGPETRVEIRTDSTISTLTLKKVIQLRTWTIQTAATQPEPAATEGDSRGPPEQPERNHAESREGPDEQSYARAARRALVQPQNPPSPWKAEVDAKIQDLADRHVKVESDIAEIKEVVSKLTEMIEAYVGTMEEIKATQAKQGDAMTAFMKKMEKEMTAMRRAVAPRRESPVMFAEEEYEESQGEAEEGSASNSDEQGWTQVRRNNTERAMDAQQRNNDIGVSIHTQRPPSAGSKRQRALRTSSSENREDLDVNRSTVSAEPKRRRRNDTQAAQRPRSGLGVPERDEEYLPSS